MEGMQSIGEDSGWKQVHGDVFRAPEQLVLFSSMLGTGWQLLLLVLAVIVYAMAGTLRLEEESSLQRSYMPSTRSILFCFLSLHLSNISMITPLLTPQLPHTGPLLHGNMYEDRGEMVSTFIVCYALSSAVGGHVSGSFYRYLIVTAL
jgi:membrane-associated HD superfamily phosphohydrolase